MWPRLLLAPWWALSLVYGGTFAALWGVFIPLRFNDHFTRGPLEHIIATILISTFYGVAMGRMAASANRDALAETGLSDRARVVAAVHASGRGRPPDDPEIRSAALRLNRYLLRKLEKNRRIGIFVQSLVVLAIILGIVFLTPWWALVLVPAVAVWAGNLTAPQRLARRIVDLQNQEDQAAPV